MLLIPFIRASLLLASRGLLVTAASAAHSADPCVKIAGSQYVDPVDAMACQKSFALNETLKQNLLSVVSRVFDSYTFEDFYLDSPAPFGESTTNIRTEIARMNATQYAVSTFSNNDTWSMNSTTV